MNLKDFAKEVAIKLNSNNVDEFKIKATQLILDDLDSLSGDELSNIINTQMYYSKVTAIFNDTEKMLKAVKRLMKETKYALQTVSEMVSNHPELYDYLNDASKNELLGKDRFDASDFPDNIFKDWLDNSRNRLWTESNMNNPLKVLLQRDVSKDRIELIVNHPKFDNFQSHYVLFTLLIEHDNLLTKDTFDKVLRRAMDIISDAGAWNTNFAKELAPLIKKQWFQEAHFDLFTDAQLEGMRTLGKNLHNVLPKHIKEILHTKFGDEEFLSDEAKEVFLF